MSSHADLTWMIRRAVIARTKENGALDTSFGTGGSPHTNFGSSTSEAIHDLKARGCLRAAALVCL